MELEGTGEIVEVKRRDDAVQPHEKRLAAVTINLHENGWIKLFCTMPEAEDFRLGHVVRLEISTDGKPVVKQPTDAQGKRPRRQNSMQTMTDVT